MKCNVGKSDRIIRALLGVSVIGAGLYFQSWFGAAGLILLFTAGVRWCPIYVPFKINTTK